MLTTNGPTALGLLRVILETPADDVPRLIFADWLEEHGEAERAKFIRLSIYYSHSDFIYLTSENRQPFQLLGIDDVYGGWGEWDSLGCVLIGKSGLSYKSDRGFVSAVGCTAEEWLRHADYLAWHPKHCNYPMPSTVQPLEKVRLTTWPDPLNPWLLKNGHIGDHLPTITKKGFAAEWPWIEPIFPSGD